MNKINKGRRQELTQLKFKKRLELRGLKPEDGKFHAFKSHSAPCSCWACRGLKYREADRAKNKFVTDKIKQSKRDDLFR